ncbi:MAG: YggS family pyridoxal phosphate-dependent enzyme [Candidatus Omnitrophica bacterium]|nr:YggS family pyridoxal phosphate-dependent enzyme [Candidatus Omnitrophota bacterium]
MITDNVKKILSELPQSVELVAAAKARTIDEVQQAVSAGVKIIGENYVQEAQIAYVVIGISAKWHFIGSLQRNKAKKAALIFDMIETVDSFETASELDKHCAKINKVIPILIEINSAKEAQKSGVLPENAEALIRKISTLGNVKVSGLMTMGPVSGDPENSRPYFMETKKIFDSIKSLNVPNVEMKHLSMGMSNSYKIALQEGANIVRIGTGIFGERKNEK